MNDDLHELDAVETGLAASIRENAGRCRNIAAIAPRILEDPVALSMVRDAWEMNRMNLANFATITETSLDVHEAIAELAEASDALRALLG